MNTDDHTAILATAIQAYLDAHDLGELAVSFVVGVHAASFENEQPDRHSYWWVAAKNQPNHITLGLIEMLNLWARTPGELDDD